MADTFSHPIELLAPAGDFDCAKAAVENGADAVYFGLQTGFNARARAANIPAERLEELMTFLRHRCVRGYLTVNTLAFPDELEEVERVIRLAISAGVDALLVQDFGVARLAQAICPELPIHASTQMSLTSGEGIRVAESLGIRRVVLARELSIAEIAQIRRQTTIELEVFVHGALCMSYSGQCLASLSLGGRSANRGQCAQACRMPYELICDGQSVGLGGVRYLVSPQDLAAYELVPRLIEAGVTAMKIEGRLKSAQYVANVTQHYRQAIDAAVSAQPVEYSRAQVEELGLSFSRGFCHGWLDGRQHRALVVGQSSANRGVYLGRVTAVRAGRVEVELAGSVRRGDGVVFESQPHEGDQQGSRVYEVFQDGRSRQEAITQGCVELTFGRDTVDFTCLKPGTRVWKTDDPRLARRLRKSYEADQPRRRVALDLVVEAAVGEPLRIDAKAASGAHCLLQSPEALPEAHKHPLTAETLREQLGRLGGSVYELRHLEARIDGQPMIPLSVLGRLRRALLEELDASIGQPPKRRVAETVAMSASGVHEASQPDTAAIEPQLIVLCRSLAQLRIAANCQITGVIADFSDLRDCSAAVATARASGKMILLATPRIQKPGETDVMAALLDAHADGILARNLAGLAALRDRNVLAVADFSLNVANRWAAEWLLGQGADRVTASYDLNRRQLVDLAGTVPPGMLEVVVHQHMPMFHMEYCVFCSRLSAGTDRATCGRPCVHHEVRLRDRVGAEHLLKADLACRNTLYNATPQTAAEAVPSLLKLGVRHFRVELLDDTAPETSVALIDVYQRLVMGHLSGKEAWGRLRTLGPRRVSRGMLDAT